ncbi:MAG: penicillin-binding protein 1C [Bdellovibrionales bacterium RIFOXYD12_FULL_39_22]|nr:MAG: penicillin-binding protein 1C [Bdellovibrionales bacterium RIFOXYB1_FULL_39_21]OFZ44448.1 MAG: penicillin-binding protein 1C [Bdellovibrionales bacterium RIFOXYC12_FULL_39_17]OFZ49910.1 MAG: penicillin-binding protein 1C [Bdellovibrionales bacterium RIFOXYC1_FULL_39_130]OFZ71688.1 MAG: penicillin-binding protein 1C [Bdellovibrionales bacterium RIFOXYC2_FULL_39_8]OFZ76915.1 MAG: penicillin-binding protein 1C [Bdellovibrionales bacterium RIFOXYD1_FULL_39_84]OFZ95842.1 MAG: penicillin-bin
MENRRQRNLLLKSSYALTILCALIFFDWWPRGSILPAIGEKSSVRIFDRYNQEMRHALSVEGERQYFLPLSEIPTQLRDAFILAEDKNFYSHWGVDFLAMARGLWQSASHFRKVSGGSTITMQLAKICWPSLRGIIHRPALILQAWSLERSYSKGEILNSYLNSIPFGNMISGVGAACRFFMGKSCDQLSLGESAVLAVLPRNPSYFLKNKKALLERRNFLLSKMKDSVEEQTLIQAKNEPIVITKSNPDFFAPHLTEKILKERPHQKEIYTTIDLELQKAISDLFFAENIKRRGTGDSGAALVIQNSTGEVLAYVGGPDFFDPAHGMVDGVLVLRSPGSALKPFVYELALENSWNLYSIVPDIPMAFSTSRAVYEPSNYGGNFSGPRSMREALGNSKNIPAIYLVDKLGEVAVLNRMRELGFSSMKNDASFYGVGIALGNAEVSLWDITSAYTILARLGEKLTTTYYKDQVGKLPSSRVLPQETTFMIADVLQDAQARREEFGRFGPLEFDYQVGVKTGTSSDYRDNWAIGFTKDITVGVWRGNADSTSMKERLSAARGVGPLFHKIMELANTYRIPRWPVPPAGIKKSLVCPLSGKRPGKFCPITTMEYHVSGNGPHEDCDVHKSLEVANCDGKSVRINYVEFPQEYFEWSRYSTLPTLSNQLLEKCGTLDLGAVKKKKNSQSLAIVGPLENSNYAIDPTIPLSHQELRFALRGVDSKDALVYVNNQKQNLEVSDNSFFWPLARGEYKFYVKSKGQRSNEVKIFVR